MSLLINFTNMRAEKHIYMYIMRIPYTFLLAPIQFCAIAIYDFW